MHGIVDVTELVGDEYPLSYSKNRCFRTFSDDGIFHVDDTHPTLISMERAEKMGLVRKKSTSLNRKRIKYKDEFHRYDITSEVYKDESEFLSDDDYPDVKFVSFVDAKLNECDPPQVIIEWEEVQ
jgi:hypothetical protein